MSRATLGELHLPGDWPKWGEAFPPDFIQQYGWHYSGCCFGVQAFFVHHNEDPAAPPHAGPSTSVCLRGFDIEWPAYLILQEQACLKRLSEILRRYVEVAEVGPLDPVAFVANLTEQELMLLHAAAGALEGIDAEDQPALANALQQSVIGILRSRMPRAPGLHPPPSAG